MAAKIRETTFIGETYKNHPNNVWPPQPEPCPTCGKTMPIDSRAAWCPDFSRFNAPVFCSAPCCKAHYGDRVE